MKKGSRVLSVSWVLLFLLFNCAQISLFSENSLTTATSLKIETLILMDKAVEPYDTCKKDIEDLKVEITKAIECESWRPKNEITVAQWKILTDPDGNLLGSFLKKWQADEKLGKTYIDEKKKQIEKGYNEIIKLESAKIKK